MEMQELVAEINTLLKKKGMAAFVEAVTVGNHLYSLARFHTEMVSAGTYKIVGPKAAERYAFVTARAGLFGLAVVPLEGSG